jgi:hypothetical protein
MRLGVGWHGVFSFEVLRGASFPPPSMVGAKKIALGRLPMHWSPPGRLVSALNVD